MIFRMASSRFAVVAPIPLSLNVARRTGTFSGATPEKPSSAASTSGLCRYAAASRDAST
jgi:hypothetical protein